MVKIKDNDYYLGLILSDLKFVIDQTAGKDENEIAGNLLLLDSIMFRIIQISENANHLSDEFKSKFGDIPWISIKGMRNKIVHNYGEVRLKIVYDTIINGIPDMYQKFSNKI